MMMKTWKIVLGTVAILGIAASTYAQPCRCCGGGNAGGSYDAAAAITVTGTVDEVRTVPGGGQGTGGLHLMLSTPSGMVEVRVGPAGFVSSKNIAFAKGDTITATGWKLTVDDGWDVLIPREIKKGEQLLTLRDAGGRPGWAGRRSMW
jgi:hypothetical protein